MKTHEMYAYELDLAEGRIEPPLHLSMPLEENKGSGQSYYELANEEINNLINPKVESIIDTKATARLVQQRAFSQFSRFRQG